MKQLFLTLTAIEIICSLFLTSCNGINLKGSIDFEKNGISEKIEIEEKM